VLSSRSIAAPLIAGVLLLAGAGLTRAQSPPPPAAPADRPLELEPYVGIARHSPAGDFLGQTPDRSHLFLGLHITATIARTRRVTFGYAPEAALIVVSGTPTYLQEIFTTSRGSATFPVSDGVAPVAGFAVSPVGFESRVNLGARWRVYGATAAGFVFFTRPTPVTEARRFNYTFEFGGGVERRIGDEWWLRVGYKFHHFSNAYSAIQNPGVDANVVMFGLGRAIGKR
jgi:hypothetical protein